MAGVGNSPCPFPRRESIKNLYRMNSGTIPHHHCINPDPRVPMAEPDHSPRPVLRFALPPAAEYSLRSFRATPRELPASGGALWDWHPAIPNNERASGTERCWFGFVGGGLGFGLMVRHVAGLGGGFWDLRSPYE